MTRRASGMREASTRPFEGGVTLSWRPLTTNDGCVTLPRKGILDQLTMASACHHAETTLVMLALQDGAVRTSPLSHRRSVVPSPHDVAISTRCLTREG